MLIGAGADVRDDIRALTSQLSNLQKQQIPFAASKAINEILKTSAPAVKAEMQRVFDRPTPWTLNSYRVLKWANKRSLFGEVGFKDLDYAGGPGGRKSSAAGVYLQPEIQGIPRRAKGLEALLRSRGLLGSGEFVVPSKFQKLDKHGNVSRGVIQKVLANLQATRDQYSRTPTGGARGGKKKAQYFFTRQGVRGAKITAIWYRSGERAIPAFIVIGAAPRYRKMFEPNTVVQREVDRRFDQEFVGAMNYALSTAR